MVERKSEGCFKLLRVYEKFIIYIIVSMFSKDFLIINGEIEYIWMFYGNN